MADVFISYSRTEQAIASVVARRLRDLGLSVFIDAEGLDGGMTFDDELDREVKSAGVILGLWSPIALASDWVKLECGVGLDRRVLVPAMIAHYPRETVPLAFYRTQHVDLTNGAHETDGENWQKLIRSIARLLNRSDLQATPIQSAQPTAKIRSISEAPKKVGQIESSATGDSGLVYGSSGTHSLGIIGSNDERLPFAEASEDELNSALSNASRDNRKRVANPRLFPWRAICSIVVRAGENPNMCTGFMVAPDLVLTAASNLAAITTGEIPGPSQVHVRTGLCQNGGDAFDGTSVREVLVHPNWSASRNAAFDVACIRLVKRLGDTSGWFSLGAFARETYVGQWITVAGFSADKRERLGDLSPNGLLDSGGLWYHSAPIIGIEDGRLFHVASTGLGYGGAPIFAYEPAYPEAALALGIHVYGRSRSPPQLDRCKSGPWIDFPMLAWIIGVRDGASR